MVFLKPLYHLYPFDSQLLLSIVTLFSFQPNGNSNVNNLRPISLVIGLSGKWVLLKQFQMVFIEMIQNGGTAISQGYPGSPLTTLAGPIIPCYRSHSLEMTKFFGIANRDPGV